MSTVYMGVNEKYAVNEEALDSLVAIKQGVIQQLSFISVLRPAEDEQKTEQYLQQLQAKYSQSVSVSYSIFRNEEPVKAIKEIMNKNHGVLVIQKGTRNLADVFRKFFTTEMIYNANIPVIILPKIDKY
jgi:ABC-type branched-subunit amino acid transport system substrate-binding protein